MIDNSKSYTVFDRESGEPILYSAYNTETGNMVPQQPSLDDIGGLPPIFIDRPKELDDSARLSEVGYPGDATYVIAQQTLSTKKEHPLVANMEEEIGTKAIADIVKTRRKKI